MNTPIFASDDDFITTLTKVFTYSDEIEIKKELVYYQSVVQTGKVRSTKVTHCKQTSYQRALNLKWNLCPLHS